MSTDRILLARIGAPHGVRGEVRLFVFAEDPESLLHYRLTDEAGRKTVRITALRAAKDHFVARLDGVSTREAAEALTNLGLHVTRDQLPPTEDEDDFYHADLIGLSAFTPEGAPFGTVVGLYDFGAGDILEIAPEAGGEGRGKTVMVPFTKAAVPVIDVKGRRLVVDVAAWVAEDKPEDGEDADSDAKPDSVGPKD
ncbi:ribosome maturation factor RimM [Ancylobacter sp. 6x-1]|uniref:Ribosome maturation factor RimM n=1 Tax=Ancylobacter crimeensis TaxID=2579147 RepID=A0ABT0DEQ9_9HYPH|nr:ribosome maturation factor RimM [Ancylobacter crimeensis]MCK0198446.1 ribosome maturation factor RimM [Ancylobacter crimeensis]